MTCPMILTFASLHYNFPFANSFNKKHSGTHITILDTTRQKIIYSFAACFIIKIAVLPLWQDNKKLQKN